jgi:hypothetical protein
MYQCTACYVFLISKYKITNFIVAQRDFSSRFSVICWKFLPLLLLCGFRCLLPWRGWRLLKSDAMYFGRLSPSFSRNCRIPTLRAGLATCNGADHPRYILDLAAKEAPGWQAICSRRRRRRKQAVTSGYRHLTPIFLRREVLYIPSATHMLCIAYIQVRIIFSSSKYLFRYSLKLLYNIEV